MTLVLIAAAAAAVVTALLTPIARQLAIRGGYVDVPGERSSHDRPTPKTGGYALLIGSAVGIAMGGAWRAGHVVVILSGALMLAVLAFIDERRQLPRLFRLVVQVAIVVWVIWGSSGFAGAAGYTPAAAIIIAGIAVIWLVGVVNTYNFMDGLNGIVGIAAVVTGLVLAVMAARRGDLAAAATAAAVAGAAAGFLPFNLTGSIFMGDAGSTMLGLVYGALVLRDDAMPVAAALPLAPFILDAGITIVRRALRGEPFFSTPHRSHFYQRLQQLGWTHAAVAWLYGGLTAVSGTIALTFDWLSTGQRIAALTVVVIGHGIVFAHIQERWSRHAGHRQTGGSQGER